MFKKFASIGTALLIAVGVTMAGAALPAAAEYADDSQQTQETPASTAPPADPSLSVASVDSTPPATCDPDAKFSYNYFSSTAAGHTANSGTVTITGIANPCKTLYVTAASWTFDGSTASPQHIDQLNKYAFNTLGTFPFTAPVNCGQGDIYASWDTYIVPPAVDLGVLHPPAPWEQGHFLHDVLAGGPTPTYVVQTSDGTLAGMATCVIQPTLPTAASVKGCDYDGSLKIPADTAKVHYVRSAGNGTTGINTVTATAQPGYVFPFVPSPGWTVVTSGHVWSSTFNLGSYPADCARPGDPAHSNQSCVNGALVSGTITVLLNPGLQYTITGPADGAGDGPTHVVTSAVTPVVPGSYIVRVQALPGFTLSGAGSWPFLVVVEPPVNCELWDASANVATVSGTCDEAGSINPLTSSIVNATWRDAVTHVAIPTLQQVPGTTYNVEAVANAGHSFPGGLLTKPISYTIDDVSTAPDCDQVTLPAAEVNAFATNQSCHVGVISTGSVTVVFPLAQETDVLYVLDGTTPIPFTTTDLVTLAVSPGAHTVTASPTGPDGIFPAVGSAGVQDPGTGVVTFSLTVSAFVGTCSDLETLALAHAGRDFDGAGVALVGAGSLFFGLGLMIVFMRRRNDASDQS
jgi:hypothetical protein